MAIIRFQITTEFLDYFRVCFKSLDKRERWEREIMRHETIFSSAIKMKSYKRHWKRKGGGGVAREESNFCSFSSQSASWQVDLSVRRHWKALPLLCFYDVSLQKTEQLGKWKIFFVKQDSNCNLFLRYSECLLQHSQHAGLWGEIMVLATNWT